MTTTALERLRGLAKEATAGEWSAVGSMIYVVCDCGGAADPDGDYNAYVQSPVLDYAPPAELDAAFIAAACNFVRSDEFDALVRDAELWRKHQPALRAANSILDAARPIVLNALRIEDAIDAERGGG